MNRLELMRTSIWPVLLLVVAFLLMTVLLVPAEAETVACQTVAALQFDSDTAVNVGSVTNQATQLTPSRSITTGGRTALPVETRNFTEIMSLILVLGIMVNLSLFRNMNAKH